MTQARPCIVLCTIGALSVALAQPMVPAPIVSYGPNLPPKLVIFTNFSLAWDTYPITNDIGFRVYVTNAATNYSQGVHVTNTQVRIVGALGTNTFALTATNSSGLESPPNTLTGAFVVDRYQRLAAQAATNLAGPWTVVPIETMTNAPGYGFLRAHLTNWTRTNWVKL